MILLNLEHDIITVWNLAWSWNIWILNDYSAKQCRAIDSKSQIRDRANFWTNEWLNNSKLANADILKILKNLEAYRRVNLSIRIIKLCGGSICKPLELIFRDCLKESMFSSFWKKAGVVLIHKKNERSLVMNYRLV